MHEDTPENAAHTWRDLADQLTSDQITRLEESERGYRERAQVPKQSWSTEPRSTRDIDALLLRLARAHARDNLVTAMVGPVPLPAGAEPWEGPWQENDPLPYGAVFGKRGNVPTSRDHCYSIRRRQF